MPSTLGIVASAKSNAFVLEWDTALGSNTVTLPLTGTVNCVVNWGDGTSDTYTTTGNKTHAYPAAGVYTMQLTGTLTGFGANVSRPQLTKCLSFGEVGLVSLANGFRTCANLTQVPASLPSTSNITNMNAMFQSATNFNQNIDGWNVANVTNMGAMFAVATSFNQNIGSWNVANVTNMSSMFFEATSFNQNIGSWNVGSVTDMFAMFQSATSFNQDIGSWNVANVTNMSRTFRSATSFNQNIGGWNVAKVVTMTEMFQSATSFNQNIGSWNVGSVTGMNSMFRLATNFNQNIGSWNVANVTNMGSMFDSATSFNQDIGSWNVANVTTMSTMFFAVTLSTANYDSLLTGWSALTLKANVTFHGGNSKYSVGAATTARGVLTGAPYNWTITDGGQL